MAKRRVLEQKLEAPIATIDSLQKVAYEKPIGTKMNDHDICLEVVLRSCQALRHIHR